MKTIDSAVVAVAGLGTRLHPTSASVPKEMLPVGRFPVLHHVLDELTAAGIGRFLLVTNPSKPAIEHYIEGLPNLSACWKDVEFNFIEQGIPEGATKPAGTGDAVALAERFVGGRDFIVAFGDSIVESDRPGSLVARMIRPMYWDTAEAAATCRTVCCIWPMRSAVAETSAWGFCVPVVRSRMLTNSSSGGEWINIFSMNRSSWASGKG